MSLGCDPELFLRRDGQIVPSREVIPPHGLKVASLEGFSSLDSTITRDGIQVEIHPAPTGRRAQIGAMIAKALSTLEKRLEKASCGFSMEFTSTVEIDVPKFAEEDLQLG